MDKSYEFGKNWRDYLKKMGKEGLEGSKKSLKIFLGIKNLGGKTFLDMGCGSGLSSLAACELGAKVYSFDIDEDSVECARYLHETKNKPKNWVITTGSVLDEKFVNSLPTSNIVYSWGVLHHTGNMYKAIKLSSSKVKKNGLFYIAIYNKTKGLFGSKFWKGFKKFYSSSGFLVREFFNFIYFVLFCFSRIFTLRNPFKEIKNYSKNNTRGMNWFTDVKDWLGGYPYEYATADEITKFCENLGFELVNLKQVKNLACNEFLFKKI